MDRHQGTAAGVAASRSVTNSRAGRVWLIFAAVEVVFLAAYFGFPDYHLWLWPPVGLCAVAATLVGVRIHRPARPLAWYLMAAAEFCFIAGDTSYRVLTDVLGQVNPFPSIADVCYLPTYPLFAGALFLFIRGRSRLRDIGSLIDALTITTGLGLLSWVYLVQPYFHASGLTVLQRAVSVGYPLGDVLVVAMLARVVVGGGLRLAATRLLVLGATGLLVADVCYGWIQLNGHWSVGGPVDLGWALFYLSWGAAALHPSMRRVDQIDKRATERMSRGRVTSLTVASFIPPTVLLIQAQKGAVTDGATVAVFSSLLFALVIARLVGIATGHRGALARERVLRLCGESLVSARDLSDVYAAAIRAVEALLAGPVAVEVSLYRVLPDGIVCVASTQPTGVGDECDPVLWQAASDGGELGNDGRQSATLMRRGDEVSGLLLVSGSAPLNWAEHGALMTLASQVALAIESVTLAADLRQRQSDAHFRGLVQNASDIIVVVDEQSVITYAAPSIERALQRRVDAVVGSPLLVFVHQDDLAAAGVLLAGVLARIGDTDAPAVADWRLRHSNGGFVSFEVVASNQLDDPSVGGIVLTMRDVSERRALEDQLTHQAFHDPLTGLPNRLLFCDRAEQALIKARAEGTTVAIVMIDVDGFKDINDTRGHGAGDELLVLVAERLRSNVRAGGVVARLGGDEFAVMVEDVDGGAQADGLARRMLIPFDSPYTVHEEQVFASASAGMVVTTGTEADLDLSGLLRCADLALYSAKKQGKGQLVRYGSDLHARMLDRISLRSDLRRAIEAHEFELHYQPIVAIDNGLIVGAEALIRWRHPTRGMVPPVEFIGLAEDSGLIVGLGRWVLDQACRQTRAWLDDGHDQLSMSVNVSGRQLQEAGFVDEVRDILQRHDIPAGVIVLELTESVLVFDGSAVPDRLAALKDLGVRIAIDDFGTGYSSLAYLTRFPVDTLKIDKSFIDGLGTGNINDGTIAQAVVSLAQTLHLDVVAEGIETAAQRDELWSIGCHHGQGYLYSKPVPADEFSALIAQRGHVGPPPVGRNEIAAPRPPAPTRHLEVARRTAVPTLVDRNHPPHSGTRSKSEKAVAPRLVGPSRPA